MVVERLQKRKITLNNILTYFLKLTQNVVPLSISDFFTKIFPLFAPLALLLATFAAYGRVGAAVLVGQAVVSVLMLETVNYIEHYGLVRENKGAVLPKHSWNSSTSYGNAVTYNLQRHSDHHANAQKPFYALESIKDAPQLPAGYPGMY